VQLRPGDVIDVAVNVEHLHLFDPDTEVSLTDAQEPVAAPAPAGTAGETA
jgi:quercetin dioxygenase-like cupin family protein